MLRGKIGINKIGSLCFLLILLWNCSGNEEVVDNQIVIPEFRDSIKLVNDRAEQKHKSGFEYLNNGNYQKALDLFTEALKLRESLMNQIRPSVDSMAKKIYKGVVRGYHQRGATFYYSGKYAEAEIELKKCIKIQEELKSAGLFFEPFRLGWTFDQLGKTYVRTRGLEEALQVFVSGLNSYDPVEDQLDYGDMLLNISNLYVLWREPDSVAKYSLLALDVYYDAEDVYGIGTAYLNLGVALKDQGKIEQALASFDSAYLYHNIGGEFELVAKDYYGKSQAFLMIDSFQAAHSYLDSAIWIDKEKNTSHEATVMLAEDYFLKAEAFFGQDDLSKANQFYLKAIQLITDFTGNPSGDIYSFSLKDQNISNRFSLLGVLEALAGLAKTKAKSGDLEASFYLYKQILVLINDFKQDFSDKESKLNLARITKEIYENAIQLSLQMGRKTEAFTFSEKSKSFILLEAFRHYKAFEVSGIDQSLLEQEQEIRIFQANINEQILRTTDKAKKVELLEKRRKKQEELNDVLAQLNENPNYRRLLNDTTSLRLPQIQQNLLADKQGLLEYFVGEDSTYAFFIPKQGQVEVFTIPIPRDELAKQVQELVYSIYIPNTTDEGNEKLKSLQEQYTTSYAASFYAEQAHALYQILLAPILDKKDLTPERLLIIPDDVLGYLPFGTLLTEPVAAENVGYYEHYDFLSEAYPISYCYSANLLQEMQLGKKEAPNNQILAFAYDEDLFSRQVKSLKNIFNTSWFSKPFVVGLHGSRTDLEQRFETEASSYKYIHFSTHGKVNDRDPNYSYLKMRKGGDADSDSLLYLYELYNIPLNAEMVVTSACETGIGQLFRGEGIMSLARGFSYAGAESIVTTLWSVSGESTQKVLNEFYSQLKKGQLKDVALYEAKRAYLNDPDKTTFLHPFYWAGIIPIGNMEAIQVTE